MSTYTCPHCGERGLSTQKRHWCPKAPKISEVLRLGPPRSRDPIANEYIDRLSRELEEAREREQHIEGQIVALVEAEVISEGKAREILGVGVDEWREIEDRTLGAGTDT